MSIEKKMRSCFSIANFHQSPGGDTQKSSPIHNANGGRMKLRHVKSQSQVIGTEKNILECIQEFSNRLNSKRTERKLAKKSNAEEFNFKCNQKRLLVYGDELECARKLREGVELNQTAKAKRMDDSRNDSKSLEKTRLKFSNKSSFHRDKRETGGQREKECKGSKTKSSFKKKNKIVDGSEFINSKRHSVDFKFFSSSPKNFTLNTENSNNKSSNRKPVKIIHKHLKKPESTKQSPQRVESFVKGIIKSANNKNSKNMLRKFSFNPKKIVRFSKNTSTKEFNHIETGEVVYNSKESPFVSSNLTEHEEWINIAYPPLVQFSDFVQEFQENLQKSSQRPRNSTKSADFSLATDINS